MRVRPVATVVLIGGFLLAGAGPKGAAAQDNAPAAGATPPPAVAPDLTPLQGAWVLTSMVFEDQLIPVPPEAGSTNAMAAPIIRGETWMEQQPGKGLTPIMTFKLLATAEPKQFDLVTADGSETAAGIYRVEGDSLTLCLTVDQDAPIRPTQFATRKGLPLMLCTYRRGDAKPDPASTSGDAPTSPVTPPPGEPSRLRDLTFDQAKEIVAADYSRLAAIQSIYERSLRTRLLLADSYRDHAESHRIRRHNTPGNQLDQIPDEYVDLLDRSQAYRVEATRLAKSLANIEAALLDAWLPHPAK